jgi:hypothetical protein
MYNNINIKDDHGNIFTYMIEYHQSNILSTLEKFGYYDDLSINFNPSTVIKKNGVWYENDASYQTDYIPEIYNTSYLRLYFPQYSIDTYQKHACYILSINTWMGEKQVNLGSFLINRLDALAIEKPIHMYDNLYYEYVEFEIVDPYYIMYSNDWEEFRKKMFANDKNFFKSNNISSILNVSLYPVEKIGDIYTPNQYYANGRNNFKLTNDSDNFFNFKLECNVREYLNDVEPSFICDLYCNEFYNSFDEYFSDVYGIENFLLQYELTLGNNNKLWGNYKSKLINSGQNIHTYNFTKSILVNDLSNINWCDGVFAVASINILNTDGETIFYALSNKIPITKDIYSYFTESDEEWLSINDYKINSVNLSNINMYQYNINAVNKIQQNIVKMTRPDHNKSNLNIPVFFSTRELSNLVLHPKVTENICINLDAYKSKVETFTIQIEDCQFHEIGRTKKGVLFKIIGEMLLNSSKPENGATTKEGIYYILNQDSELVSSGKYTYLI